MYKFDTHYVDFIQIIYVMRANALKNSTYTALFISYQTIERHSVPYSTVPYSTVPYCTVPYCTVPYCPNRHSVDAGSLAPTGTGAPIAPSRGA
jgi:hypothetical protein